VQLSRPKAFLDLQSAFQVHTCDDATRLTVVYTQEPGTDRVRGGHSTRRGHLEYTLEVFVRHALQVGTSIKLYWFYPLVFSIVPEPVPESHRRPYLA
jgi:hypothetical protein